MKASNRAVYFCVKLKRSKAGGVAKNQHYLSCNLAEIFVQTTLPGGVYVEMITPDTFKNRKQHYKKEPK